MYSPWSRCWEGPLHHIIYKYLFHKIWITHVATSASQGALQYIENTIQYNTLYIHNTLDVTASISDYNIILLYQHYVLESLKAPTLNNEVLKGFKYLNIFVNSNIITTIFTNSNGSRWGNSGVHRVQ